MKENFPPFGVCHLRAKWNSFISLGWRSWRINFQPCFRFPKCLKFMCCSGSSPHVNSCGGPISMKKASSHLGLLRKWHPPSHNIQLKDTRERNSEGMALWRHMYLKWTPKKWTHLGYLEPQRSSWSSRDSLKGLVASLLYSGDEELQLPAPWLSPTLWLTM